MEEKVDEKKRKDGRNGREWKGKERGETVNKEYEKTRKERENNRIK